MAIEKLNGTLQENIISLLAHSDTHGRVIAGMVQPTLFEGEYRTIAERAIDYWQRYDEAPKDHMVDLVGEELDSRNRKHKTYRRILGAMLELHDGINVRYVMDQLHLFVRMQRFKDAIIKSAEQLNSEQEIAVGEVEKLWSELLNERRVHAEPPTTLNDVKRLMLYLETQYGEFITGIKPFDDREVVPSRGAIMMLVGAAKRGKSWFLVQVSSVNLLQRKKVVYFSHEMDDMQVLQRHYQRLFSVQKYGREQTNRTLIRNDEGKLVGIDSETHLNDFSLKGAGADTNLEILVRALGPKAHNLKIKRYPARTATMADLEAYLDYLEVSEGFIPDLIINDYCAIMKGIDPKQPRISIGRLTEEFRALCVKRNAAGVTVGQMSKKGAEAMTAGAGHVAEDWSTIGTADITIVFSATDAEKALGLGRARVTNARDQADNFGVLMTQNYESGQFCIDSVMLTSDYFDMLDELKDEHDLPEDEIEEEDD